MYVNARSLMRSSLIVIVALLSTFLNFGNTSIQAQSADQRERLLTAIGNLDSNRFIIREQATQTLIDAGVDSIGLLLEILPSATPETRRRGMIVIQRLAIADDLTAETAARDALKRLADSDQVALANRARRMLDYANSVREVKTLRTFEREGAVVTRRGANVNGEYFQVPYAIEIDERWQGDASQLKRLGFLTGIRHVSLAGERITDEAIEQLQNMPQLVIVHLKDAAITDAAIAALTGTPALVELEVKYCPITDASVEQLVKLRNLQTLNLYGTDLTRDAAIRLTTELTQTEVDYRAGGFLGVRCTTEGDTCLVTYIEPESAAQQAGMLAGDVITEFNMNPVSSMESLIDQIGKANVDERVEIVFRRNDETFRRAVKLGKWK